MNSKVNGLLLLNIPGFFELNLVENSFSAIRAAFRRRPIAETLAEEMSYLSRLFFEPGNRKRFQGYSRNLLRTMIQVIDDFLEETVER